MLDYIQPSPVEGLSWIKLQVRTIILKLQTRDIQNVKRERVGDIGEKD